MSTLEQVQDPMGQVFALASDCDATQLRLTAAEGYLLSRIDGVTPWRLLREMGGIPAAQVDTCLARWQDEGVLVVVAGKASPARPSARESQSVDAAEAPTQGTTLLAIDESALDDSLEIDVSIQRRILEFEASLGRPYHELLDVPKGSEPKIVKRAYFKLSKEFHPDRYFRKQIGDYGVRLDRIFKKVLEAHEMLSDPDLCQVENQPEPVEGEAAPPTAATTAPVVEAQAPPEPVAPAKEEAPPKPRVLSKLERLRQRMPFKIDHAAFVARRAKAAEIFKAAELSQRAGRLAEAEASIRIAISFDPARPEFKEALGSIRIQAAGARASKLLASPSDRMSDGELREALTLLEDVLIYRPHDPELNERAARVCIQLGKHADAREYAQTLVERMPESADAHTLLGRIHRAAGDLGRATRCFEMALKHDADNSEARRSLASLRIGARDVARGGQS